MTPEPALVVCLSLVPAWEILGMHNFYYQIQPLMERTCGL